MSIKRLTIDGYGQLELNNVAFRRDGRIEAQCAVDSSDFSNTKVENGMLLAVDNITRKVKLPTDATLPIALVYTAEHMYDERKGGLKDFATSATDDFYPRLGYPVRGDKFTTNCICYDDTVYATETALISALEAFASNSLYGALESNGVISITSATSAPTFGPKLLVIDGKATMPDGRRAVKFQVVEE